MWRRHDVNFTGNGLVNWNVVSKASFLVTFEGAFMDKEEKYDSIAFGKKKQKTQKRSRLIGRLCQKITYILSDKLICTIEW